MEWGEATTKTQKIPPPGGGGTIITSQLLFVANRIRCIIALGRTFCISALLCALDNNNFRNMAVARVNRYRNRRNTISICTRLTNFSKGCNLIKSRVRISCNSRFELGRVFAVLLRDFRLSGHDDLTGSRNKLFVVRLVNIASQSRNQQGGQNGQDDQNDDELYQGEALLVLLLRIFSNMINSSTKFYKDSMRPRL